MVRAYTKRGHRKERDKCAMGFSINTDREIQANPPGIIIKDKSKQECHLIDVAIPSNVNVSVKEFEKKSKYKDLEIEIQRI